MTLPPGIVSAIDDALETQEKELGDALVKYAGPSHILGDVTGFEKLGMKVNWQQVQKEAVAYGKEYGKLLKETGTIKIPLTEKAIRNGKEIEIFAGYEDYPLLPNTTKTNRAAISKIIQNGLKEGKPTGYKEWKAGKGYPEGTVAHDLNQYFNQRKSHASLVAQTERARIQGEGMKTRFTQSGIHYGRWQTVGDNLVRPEHTDREAAGTIPLSEMPSLGEPGCRCTIIPVPDSEARELGLEIPEDTAPETLPERPTGVKYDMVTSENLNSADENEKLYNRAYKHGMTPEEYSKAVTERMKEINNNADWGIRVDREPLEKILKEGRFKSQFEVKSSKGMYDPKYRKELEKELFGAPIDLNDADRPIYGMMFDDTVSSRAGEQYGELKVILKKDAIRSRTTFTYGDSIDNGGFGGGFKPSLINDPSPVSANWIGKSDPLVNLRDAKGVNDIVPDYAEIQIHGRVTLADIEEIRAPQGLRTGQIQQMCAQLGIRFVLI